MVAMKSNRAHWIESNMTDLPEHIRARLSFSDSLAELRASEAELRKSFAESEAVRVSSEAHIRRQLDQNKGGRKSRR
jgi:hypothetical protein